MSTTVQLPPQKPPKPPASRNYAVTSEQIEIDILKQRMFEIEKNLAALNDELDKGNESALEKITAIREGLKILQQMIYGEPLYFLPGLGIQVKNMNLILEQMQADKDAQLNQIKGMKIALYVISAVAGIPALGAIIPMIGQVLGAI